MLAYAAMMIGQREVAMKHIRAMVANLPADFVKENALQAEGSVAMPMEVMVRFGRWNEILAEPNNYPEYMASTRAFHHAARAIAYAARATGERTQGTGDLPGEGKTGSEGNNAWQQHRGSNPRFGYANGGRRDPGPRRKSRRGN